jgi:hypothetical protein
MEKMARELTDPTLELLEEFTVAWLRGETPDPRETLERAPDAERAELSALIERFLARQPSREPTAESLAYIKAIADLAGDTAPVVSEPPLLEARNRLGLKRAPVVEALRTALGLPERDSPKLGRYYHRLESGLLDASRVSERVWDALESILQWRGDPTHQPLAATADAFFRRTGSSKAPDSELVASLGFGNEPEPAEWEEIDGLFLGSKPGADVHT